MNLLIFTLILAEWHVVVDDHIIKLKNPRCPDCVVTSDIQLQLTDRYISIKTEFIFKGGFE